MSLESASAASESPQRCRWCRNVVENLPGCPSCWLYLPCSPLCSRTHRAAAMRPLWAAIREVLPGAWDLFCAVPGAVGSAAPQRCEEGPAGLKTFAPAVCALFWSLCSTSNVGAGFTFDCRVLSQAWTHPREGEVGMTADSKCLVSPLAGEIRFA